MFKFVRGFIALSLFASMVFFGCAKEELVVLELVDGSNTLIGNNTSPIDIGNPAARIAPRGSCQCRLEVLETSSMTGSQWKIGQFENDTSDDDSSPFYGDDQLFRIDGNWNTDDLVTYWEDSDGHFGEGLPNEPAQDLVAYPGGDLGDRQLQEIDFLYPGLNENFQIRVRIRCYDTSKNPEVLKTTRIYNFIQPSNATAFGVWTERICTSCAYIADGDCLQFPG